MKEILVAPYETPETEKEAMDFTDPALKLDIEMRPEALVALPEILTKDIKSGEVIPHVIIGSWRAGEKGRALVSISHVWTTTETRAQELLKTDPNYDGLEIIGNLKTHPVRPGSNIFDRPWLMTDQEQQGLKTMYESGQLDVHKPFIFAVAGFRRNSDGTSYTFYRMTQTEEGYKPQNI